MSDAAARELFAGATRRLAELDLEVGDAVEVAAVSDVRRRRLRDIDADDTGFLSLVRGDDGLYDWEVDSGPARFPSRRLGRRGVFDPPPIDQVAFKAVQGSSWSAFLSRLDRRYNDRYGLFDLDGVRVDTVARDGRVLLVVHGTFSKCDAIVGQLGAAAGGRALLAAARDRYDQVLLYEHPTLAVGPFLNALDLTRAFAGSTAAVDVVCHSRGGLVARWWLEVLSRDVGERARVVFVGAPLMGTGLASPYRLRTALKTLTNYAIALREASSYVSLAMPVFTLAEGLMTLVASATTLLSRTPVADLAVATVPGLAAMSRYGPDVKEYIQGNYELEKLGYGWRTAPPGYFAVSSNFESEAVGWQFWKAFRGAGTRLADAATDALFAGDNDLVVDTDSMTRMAAATLIDGPGRRLEYGTNAAVHHLNYFEQARTADFIRASLRF